MTGRANEDHEAVVEIEVRVGEAKVRVGAVIGMKLLQGHDSHIQVKPGGEVRVVPA